MVPFSFSGQEMRLVQGRAVFWPAEDTLLVADLHLEKASFFAAHGQMLPPYDSRETLGRLALAVRETGARRVVALGDNFHDAGGGDRLEPHAAGMLAALTSALDWVWIDGNHDHGITPEAGSEVMDEVEIGGILLRHAAQPGLAGSEISGHYHPKLTLRTRGRRIARACAVIGTGKGGDERMILPAFGALTGGMDASDPAIVSAMQPAERISALLPASNRLLSYPVWQAAA